MNPPRTSIIIVSRGRPDSLRLTLLSLQQQDHPDFEVIVVADPEGIKAAQGFLVKAMEFGEANISKARNAGTALAAAPVVAFIDDDAVAEPTWASRLTAPLADPQVKAAAGFTRGANGISLQWGAARVDGAGMDHPFDPGTQGGLFSAAGDMVIKTPGTNCAFNRAALLAAGGFDPGFRFFLEETDLNRRLRALTAAVPTAQVLHAFAASSRRDATRKPLDLTDIGQSTARFLRRHRGEAAALAHWPRLLAEQTARLTRLPSEERNQLLSGLALGWERGLQAQLTLPAPLALAPPPFLPFAAGHAGGAVFSGRIWSRQSLLNQARAARAAGRVVTLFLFSPTARPHRLSFTPEGIWLQEGGLFGRADRHHRTFRLTSFARRVRTEVARWAGLRPVD